MASVHPSPSIASECNGTCDYQAKEATEVLLEDTISENKKFNWNAQWYPIAVAAELDKGVPHAATILGRELVVWWDRNGRSWQVFVDKCPHRLAPLSEGRINEQGQLQCCYHGWSFAPCSGACTCIPQAPPDRNSVWESNRAYATVYPSIEQQGLIWFWPDTRPEFKDIATTQPPPLIPIISDPSFKDDMSMRDLPYGYEQLLENLMDPSHVPFAHHGLQGDRKKARPLILKVEKFNKSGFIGRRENGPAVFTAPCVLLLHVEFPSPQSKDKTDGLTFTKKMFLVFICVPVSPGRSRLIWTFPRNFSLWFHFLKPLWFRHIEQMLIIDSDLYILHILERNLEKNHNLSWEKSCYVPTVADAFVITFRRWLRIYAGGAPDWGDNYDNQLPPVATKEQLMDRYHSHVVMCHSCRSALHFFKGVEILMQVLSVGLAAVLGAIALKPLPYLRSWSIPLVCAAVLCSVASIRLSHFIKKTFYFRVYNHAILK